MAEVRCAKHGVFHYKTATCPGCLNDVRRRYEELATELGAPQRTRLFGTDAVPAPISIEALAVLRTEDPAGADFVLAELERVARDYEERQRERENIVANLTALSKTHGRTYRMGSPGLTYEGRLLGAVDIGAKRYAQLRRRLLDGGDTVCVPWIDAFAERVGQEIVVQWVDPNKDERFIVSTGDSTIDAFKPRRS